MGFSFFSSFGLFALFSPSKQSQGLDKEFIGNLIRPLKNYVTERVRVTVAGFLEKKGVRLTLPSENSNVCEQREGERLYILSGVRLIFYFYLTFCLYFL